MSQSAANYKFNVDELLAESDDDDDDEDEEMLSDPELEKFKQKTGIAKAGQSQKIGS